MAVLGSVWMEGPERFHSQDLRSISYQERRECSNESQNPTAFTRALSEGLPQCTSSFTLALSTYLASLLTSPMKAAQALLQATRPSEMKVGGNNSADLHSWLHTTVPLENRNNPADLHSRLHTNGNFGIVSRLLTISAT